MTTPDTASAAGSATASAASAASATTGATAILGSFVAECARATLPADVVDKAAFCLLDTIGLAALARDEASVTMMDALLTDVSGANAATVWNSGRRVSVTEAVTANAIAVHAQFHDDTDYSSWTHPGSLVVPVAVALGEARNADISEVLRAIAIGYDTIEWLGARDLVARALIDRGIRTSPTLGTIAAAATAAAMLQLDATQAINAIGIASGITGGVLEPVRCGSDEWRVQNAHAARGGLLAAQLAQQGMQGAPLGLEGPKGLLRSLAGLQEVPPVWHSAPDVRAILGVVAKPWATLGDNMSAVIAAQLVHEQGIDAERIKSIHIKIWRHFTEYPGTSYRGPFDRVPQALASMAFGTAAMLIHGEVEYDKPLHHRNDERILCMLPLITIEPDDKGNPFDATVTVTLDDGTVIRKEAKDAPSTQLLHDRATATGLFEARMQRSGYAADIGTALAQRVLSGDIGIGAVLGALARKSA